MMIKRNPSHVKLKSIYRFRRRATYYFYFFCFSTSFHRKSLTVSNNMLLEAEIMTMTLTKVKIQDYFRENVFFFPSTYENENSLFTATLNSSDRLGI